MRVLTIATCISFRHYNCWQPYKMYWWRKAIQRNNVC